MVIPNRWAAQRPELDPDVVGPPGSDAYRDLVWDAEADPTLPSWAGGAMRALSFYTRAHQFRQVAMTARLLAAVATREAGETPPPPRPARPGPRDQQVGAWARDVMRDLADALRQHRYADAAAIAKTLAVQADQWGRVTRPGRGG